MLRSFSCRGIAALLTLATILVSFSASAGLCAKCAGKMFITNIGKCVICGGATSSGAFKICQACSAAKNQCEACRASLLAIQKVAPPDAAPAPETKSAVPPGTADKPVVLPGAAPTLKITPVAPPVAVPITKKKPVVPTGVKVKPTAVAPAAPTGK